MFLCLTSRTHMFDNVLQERTVTVHRERIGGLGLSVKGGAEHNLPVLISRIFKDQAGKSNIKLNCMVNTINYSYDDFLLGNSIYASCDFISKLSYSNNALYIGEGNDLYEK